MPSPSTSLATLRPDLAGSFLEFDLAMNQMGFIATRALPTVEVAKASGVFGQIPIEQLLQTRDTMRAPGTGYARGNWDFTTASFACVEHGAEEPVDDNEATLYNQYFDAEQVSAARARNAVLLNAEVRAAALLYDTATWTGAALTTALTNEWDDFVNATPISDVLAAAKLVWDGSGLWPNALICNRKQAKNLKNCANVIDRIKYWGGQDPNLGSITDQALAQALDLDMVIVADSATNSATEGQAATVAGIWSDEYAMVAKVATTNDIREPCVGRVFHWSEDGSTIGGTFESYREEATRSDIIRVRHQVDELVLYPQAAHLLSNVTT